MDTYTDWKPHSIVEGKCLTCGYRFYTAIEIMTDSELQEERDNHFEITDDKIDWPDRKKLNKETLKSYDDLICITTNTASQY